MAVTYGSNYLLISHYSLQYSSLIIDMGRSNYLLISHYSLHNSVPPEVASRSNYLLISHYSLLSFECVKLTTLFQLSLNFTLFLI